MSTDIEISHEDAVVFPDADIDKAGLVHYYEQIFAKMRPFLERYPLAMKRYPDGVGEKGFFNKHIPKGFPDWIERVRIPKKEGGDYEAPLLNSQDALCLAVNQRMVTPHLYLFHHEDLKHPDRMVFDIDPPEGIRDFSAVRQAALDIRSVLDTLDMQAWVQTTGSSGFHVWVPLDRSNSFDEVRSFARGVAEYLVKKNPEDYTLEQQVDQRGKRIFLDVLRNSYGASSVAPYGVRARKGAPVATPVDWEELEQGAEPADWHLGNILNRVARKDDPWEDIYRHRYAIGDRHHQLNELYEDL